jgi:hypothetical protein
MVDIPLLALDLKKAREGKAIRVRGVVGGEMSVSLLLLIVDELEGEREAMLCWCCCCGSRQSGGGW